YSNLLGLNEEEFDRSRVVRVSDPKKCVLVAACSDDDHLNDAPSTLEDTFIGGSSKTPALLWLLPLLASTGSLVHL
ncbi:hypothetical protein H0E87_026774, partial [Populus deltoides]